MYEQFDLNLCPCDLNIYFLGASTVLRLGTFQRRCQEILSGQHFFKDQQFDLDLRPCELNINRGCLILRGIKCTKFGNFQAKGSKDVERPLLGLESDKLNCSLFFKVGDIKMKMAEIVIRLIYLFEFYVYALACIM